MRAHLEVSATVYGTWARQKNMDDPTKSNQRSSTKTTLTPQKRDNTDRQYTNHSDNTQITLTIQIDNTKRDNTDRQYTNHSDNITQITLTIQIDNTQRDNTDRQYTNHSDNTQITLTTLHKSL